MQPPHTAAKQLQRWVQDLQAEHRHDRVSSRVWQSCMLPGTKKRQVGPAAALGLSMVAADSMVAGWLSFSPQLGQWRRPVALATHCMLNRGVLQLELAEQQTAAVLPCCGTTRHALGNLCGPCSLTCRTAKGRQAAAQQGQQQQGRQAGRCRRPQQGHTCQGAACSQHTCTGVSDALISSQPASIDCSAVLTQPIDHRQSCIDTSALQSAQQVHQRQPPHSTRPLANC
jgi:hypothetical protein